MLKSSVPDYVDPRKSAYRPVRKAKLESKETWNCLSVDWPLEIVVKAFTLLDVVRGTLDTAICVVLLFFLLDIEYGDVVLIHSDHAQIYMDLFQDANSTQFTSVSKREYERFFKHSKTTLCILVGITSFLVFAEVPLAAYLFRAVRKKERASITIWKQISIVFIFFNFIGFTAILVYTSKAGLILDNETWITHSGSNMRVLIYFTILRTATFDLTKGCEIVIVNAFYREITRKKKVVQMVDDHDHDEEGSLSP